MESNIGAQGQLRRSGVAVAVTAFPTTVALFSIVMYVCFLFPFPYVLAVGFSNGGEWF